jgi:hypothetical protein
MDNVSGPAWINAFSSLDAPIPLSKNIQRRDLTAGQRALIAAKAWELNGYSKGGYQGNKKTGPSQSATNSVKALARQFHVSDNSIAQARDLLAEAPDLAARVEAGESLAAAYKELEQRREDAKKHERRQAG